MSLAERRLPSTAAFLGAAGRGLLVLCCSTAVGFALAVGAPAIGLAAAAVLAAAAAVLLSGHPARGLLFLVFLCAPVDVGKSLVAPVNGVLVPDAPGLSVSAMDLAAVAWAGLWLWRRLFLERRRIEWSRIDVAVWCFLGWIWLEALRSPANGLALATALAYSKFVLMFFVVSHAVRSVEEWRAVMYACVAIFALQAVEVAAQMITGSPLPLPGAKVPDGGATVSFGNEGAAFRPTGFFNHPNALADYLVLFLPTPVCLLLCGRKAVSARVRWISLLCAACGSAMLGLTLSRGGWISFGVSLVACVAACWRAGALSGRQVRLGAIAVVAVLVLAFVSTPRLWLRLTAPDSRSLESRALLVEQAMEMIRDRPLLGVGFGGYYRASRDYSAPGFAKVSPEYQKSLRRLVVHNHYLLLAAELGVPAALLFFGIMIALVTRILPIRSWPDPGRFCLAVGLASALLGNLLFLSSDNYYADIRMAMLWLVAGLLQAACLGRREDRHRRPVSRTRSVVP